MALILIIATVHSFCCLLFLFSIYSHYDMPKSGGDIGGMGADGLGLAPWDSKGKPILRKFDAMEKK